ncbi:MAG: SDR family oxidoreductase [Bauldia sp.]
MATTDPYRLDGKVGRRAASAPRSPGASCGSGPRSFSPIVPTPVGRLMKPAEIASGAAFLAFDVASGITGHFLMVDGGYSAA